MHLLVNASLTIIANQSSQVSIDAYLIPVYKECVKKQITTPNGSIKSLLTLNWQPYPIYINPDIDFRYKLNITSSLPNQLISSWNLLSNIQGNESVIVADLPAVSFNIYSLPYQIDWGNNNPSSLFQRTFKFVQDSRFTTSWNTTLCETCHLVFDLINPDIEIYATPIEINLPVYNKIFHLTSQYTYRCSTAVFQNYPYFYPYCNTLIIRIYMLAHQQKDIPQNYYDRKTNEILIFISERDFFLPKIERIMSFNGIGGVKYNPSYKIKVSWKKIDNISNKTATDIYPINVAYLLKPFSQ